MNSVSRGCRPLGSTVSGGRIAELDLVADPAKLLHLAIAR